MYEITLKNTKTKEQIWLHRRFETKKEAEILAKKMFPKVRKNVVVIVKSCALILLIQIANAQNVSPVKEQETNNVSVVQVDPKREKLMKDLAFAEANRDAYNAKKQALPKPKTDKKGHDIGPITTKDYNAKWKPLEEQRNAWDNEAARIRKELGIK